MLDCNLLAVGHFMGNCSVWDFGTGQMKHNLIGHVGAILCVDLNTKYQILVTGSTDRTVKVWGLQSENSLYSIEIVEPSWIYCVSLNFNSMNPKLMEIVFREKNILQHCQFEISRHFDVCHKNTTSHDINKISTLNNLSHKKYNSVIKGIKIEKCPFKDDPDNEVIHQAVVNDRKFYMIASGKCFSLILLATWMPLLCVLKTSTLELVGTFRFHRRPL